MEFKYGLFYAATAYKGLLIAPLMELKFRINSILWLSPFALLIAPLMELKCL